MAPFILQKFDISWDKGERSWSYLQHVGNYLIFYKCKKCEKLIITYKLIIVTQNFLAYSNYIGVASNHLSHTTLAFTVLQ